MTKGVYVMQFVLGYSQQEITPSLPFAMAGYRPLRYCSGVQDPLYVRTLLIKNNDTEEVTAFITFDLIGVDHLLIDRIKKGAEQRGLNITSFVISASHTHSGPAGVLNTMKGPLKNMSDFFGAPQLPFINEISEKTLNSLEESSESWHAFRLESRQTTFNNIGSIRKDKSSRTDPNLLLIRFLLDNEKQILLYSFACQASVLGEENSLFSGDFPSAVIKHNRTEDMVMFFNGNAGNINTKTITQSDSYEQMDEFGRQISYETKILLKHPDYVGPLENLVIKNYQIDLKRKRVESFENMSETFTVGYQIIQLNDLKIIALPVEMTSDVMEDIKFDFNVSCFCYTNGYDCIMTSINSFEHESYESLMSPFQKGEAEKLVKHIEKNL